MSTRLYYASDVHGSERCWRKFLNGAKVYRADVIVMGGDIAGKALVPIIDEGDGRWHSTYLGQSVDLDASNLDQFISDVRVNGMYPCQMSTRELARLNADQVARDDLFERVMVEEAQRWVDIAEEKLAGGHTRAFIMAGNDDPWALDSALQQGVALEHCDNSVVRFGDYEMLSLGYSNPTPWDSPRELDEDALLAKIDSLAEQLENLDRSIFNLHAPPYDSGLDVAPALDERLTPRIGAGMVETAAVGSRAVRAAIEKYQPLVSLHGHIHESRGAVKIGRTLAINPGSDYSSGRVDGCLLTLDGANVKTHQFVAG